MEGTQEMPYEENVKEVKNTQSIEEQGEFLGFEDDIVQKKKSVKENVSRAEQNTLHRINPELSPISRYNAIDDSICKISKLTYNCKDRHDQNANIEAMSQYQNNDNEHCIEAADCKEKSHIIKEDEELISSIGKRKFTIKFELPLNKLLNKDSSCNEDPEEILEKYSHVDSAELAFGQTAGKCEKNPKESLKYDETIQNADENYEREEYHYNKLEGRSKVQIETSSEDESGLFINGDDIVYCICRTSDISRFMIGCDSCEEWYHGDCIDITEESAAAIRKFYCTFCLAENPKLEVVYKRKKPEPPIKLEQTPPNKQQQIPPNKQQQTPPNKQQQTPPNKQQQTPPNKPQPTSPSKSQQTPPNKPQQTCDINWNFQNVVKKEKNNHKRLFHVDKENNKVIKKVSKSKKLVTKSKIISEFKKKRKFSKARHNKILKKRVIKKNIKNENEITDEDENEMTDEGDNEMTDEGDNEMTDGGENEMTDEDEISITSSRICLGPECTKSPRPMSRYCSEECGLRLAEELYAEIAAGANNRITQEADDYTFSDTFSVLFDKEQSGNINKGHKIESHGVVKQVSKKGHFKCLVCDRRYSSQRTLKTHMLNHSGQKPIACTECHFKTTKKDILNRHMLTHTGEKPFKCPLCQFRCAQNGILKRHLLTHTNEKPFGCTTCDYRCKLKGHLKAHMLTHTNVKMFACSECEYRSKTQGGLKAHMLTHTGEKPYSCQECSFKCAQKSHLNRHMITHKSEKPFKCLQCDYRCALKHHLKSHMLNHTNEKSFACTYCEYRSKTQWSLKEHLMIHTGDYPFECFDCDYRCSKASVFKQHLLTHTDEKPFSCSLCQLKFKRKDNLKAHMTIHTGDKAFSCTECGMNFKQSSYLKKHMLTHIGYKPLVCSVCSMRFTHSAALAKHVLMHDGEQTFSCTECNFETTEKEKIKFHMLSHAGNPFACIKCEFKCRKSNLFNSDMVSRVAVS